MSDGQVLNSMILGGLAFLLVTHVLYVLAHQYGSAARRHDLIRSIQLKRRQYLRQQEAERSDQSVDVEVLDEASEQAAVENPAEHPAPALELPPQSAQPARRAA